MVGTVAREHSGPALTISFLIAGFAAGLSAFCYAELACRCPSAGSAYHYSYICLGEGFVFLSPFHLVCVWIRLCEIDFEVCVNLFNMILLKKLITLFSVLLG